MTAPKLSLKKLGKLYDKIRPILGGEMGRVISFSALSRIADQIDLAVSKPIRRDYLRQTLELYQGKTLTPQLAEYMSMQLAARYSELMYSVVRSYDRPPREEWHPLEIYTLASCDWQGNRRGFKMGLYCLGGTMAGRLLFKKVPESWLHGFAYRVGFSMRRSFDGEFRNLLGLRFWGLISNDDERHDLNVSEWDTDNQTIAHNRVILAKRYRFDTEAAYPYNDKKMEKAACGFELDCYCHECTKTVLDCPASVIRNPHNGQDLVLEASSAKV